MNSRKHGAIYYLGGGKNNWLLSWDELEARACEEYGIKCGIMNDDSFFTSYSFTRFAIFPFLSIVKGLFIPLFWKIYTVHQTLKRLVFLYCWYSCRTWAAGTWVLSPGSMIFGSNGLVTLFHFGVFSHPSSPTSPSPDLLAVVWTSFLDQSDTLLSRKDQRNLYWILCIASWKFTLSTGAHVRRNNR